MAAHYAREQQLFGANTPYYGWLYPPIFFVLAAPLALLPYPLALAVWQGSTLALYLAVIAAILYRARRRNGVIARLWLPVSGSLSCGLHQSRPRSKRVSERGPIWCSADLLAAATHHRGHAVRPARVQAAIGACHRVRTACCGAMAAITAAAAAVIVLASVSLLLFGADAWWSFLASTETSRKLLLEEGNVGFEKLQSAFAAVRMWGGSVTLAYMVQGAISAVAICGAAWVWHSNQHPDVKAALLLAATPLASPHILDYDLMLLAPSLAFFVAARSDAHFRNYEISLLASVWIAPLIARTIAGLTAAPIGFLASLILFVLIVRVPRGCDEPAPALRWHRSSRSVELRRTSRFAHLTKLRTAN